MANQLVGTHRATTRAAVRSRMNRQGTLRRRMVGAVAAMVISTPLLVATETAQAVASPAHTATTGDVVVTYYDEGRGFTDADWELFVDIDYADLPSTFNANGEVWDVTRGHFRLAGEDPVGSDTAELHELSIVLSQPHMDRKAWVYADAEDAIEWAYLSLVDGRLEARFTVEGSYKPQGSTVSQPLRFSLEINAFVAVVSDPDVYPLIGGGVGSGTYTQWEGPEDVRVNDPNRGRGMSYFGGASVGRSPHESDFQWTTFGFAGTLVVDGQQRIIDFPTCGVMDGSVRGVRRDHKDLGGELFQDSGIITEAYLDCSYLTAFHLAGEDLDDGIGTYAVTYHSPALNAGYGPVVAYRATFTAELEVCDGNSDCVSGPVELSITGYGDGPHTLYTQRDLAAS